MAFPCPLGCTLIGHAKYQGGLGGGIFCIGEGEIGYNILRWVLNHAILKYKSYDICLSQNHMSEMDPDNYKDTVK